MPVPKLKPEYCWMAWSPDRNYLPQAASVSRIVCKAMIKERGWSQRVKCKRVLITPVQRKAKKK